MLPIGMVIDILQLVALSLIATRVAALSSAIDSHKNTMSQELERLRDSVQGHHGENKQD